MMQFPLGSMFLPGQPANVENGTVEVAKRVREAMVLRFDRIIKRNAVNWYAATEEFDLGND